MCTPLWDSWEGSLCKLIFQTEGVWFWKTEHTIQISHRETDKTIQMSVSPSVCLLSAICLPLCSVDPLLSLFQTCGQWATSLVIFVAVLNVAPRAPYQQHNKNSWEQLNTGFNSSLTTEVKIIAQGFQMEVASKELFSYHKLSASTACIP